MPVLRRASLALTAVAALALGGCGTSSEKVTEAPTSTAPSAITGTSATPSPTATGSTTGPTPSDSATTATADCGPGLADGTWTGPVTMDVDGRGGQSGFASSRGRGTMKLVVAGGRVTSGRWTVAWKSEGHADTGQAAATIKLDGRIGGTAKGVATGPTLLGTWTIHGTATITKPVHSSAPVEETGKDTEKLTLEAATCEAVTGSFLPSFNSKNAAATFTGKAEWAGRRVS